MEPWKPPEMAMTAMRSLSRASFVWQLESVTDQASADRTMTYILGSDAWLMKRALCIRPRSPIVIGDGIRKLDLVFVWGEVGEDAHPLHPDFVRSIRDECKAAGVKFIFGGWGDWVPRSQTFDRHPWHASRVPDEAGLVRVFWPLLSRANAVTVAPEPRPPGVMITDWGTIDQNGMWWEQTTPWNGHDDDGKGEAVMYRVGAASSGAFIDGVDHGLAVPSRTS